MKKTIFGFIVLLVLIVSVLTNCSSTPAAIPEPDPVPEKIHANAVDVSFSDDHNQIKLFSEKNNEQIFDIAEIKSKAGYEKLAGRLKLGGPFIFYLIPNSDPYRRGYIAIEIEGLISIDEFDEYVAKETERRAEVVKWGGAAFFITEWQKVFATKEDAKNWADSIVGRVNNVRSVVAARRKLYDDNVSAFKYFPSRMMLDTVTKNKNDLIESLNRYRPIRQEVVNKIYTAGAIFEFASTYNDRHLSGFRIYTERFPTELGYTEQEIVEAIEKINNEYAILIDTYPVN